MRVALAVCVDASRYGDAHVSFQSSGEGTRKWACSTARSRSSPERATASAAARRSCSPTTAPRSSSTTSAARSPAKAPTKRAADEVVEVIKSRGGEAVANYDSVADFDGAENIIETAIDAFGRLDVLVNNAGILRDKMMFSMSPEDFDAVVKVHMYGAFNTMHHASAYWRNESKEGRQPRASIINTVSSAGLQGQASQINYGAAKAGIAAMTIIASLELDALRRARQLHRPRRRHPHGRRRR